MGDRLNDFLVFARAVECGSLSAAARDLTLTPSAVSRVVGRLEKRFGVRLLSRNARALTLTPEGLMFLDRAQAALEAFAKAEDAASWAKAAKGRIRIYCMPTFACSQLVPILPDFLATYPDIELEFVIGTDPVNPGVSGYDVVIRSTAVSETRLVAFKLASTRWLICASPDYIASHGEPRDPDDLADHECLVFALHSEVNNWPFIWNGKPVERQVHGRIAASQGDVLAGLVRRGAGIARLTEYHVHREIDRGHLVEVLKDFHNGAVEPMYAIYERTRASSPRLQVFLDFIKTAFASPPWRSDSRS